MIASYEMFIAGAWTPASDQATLESTEPFSGETWATFPAGTPEDVDRAVRAAHSAWEESGWAQDPKRRARLIHQLADRLDEHAEQLAQIESRDNGKTIREELAMNRATPSWYRYQAALAETVAGASPVGNNPNVLTLTEREPYGVIGIQTPWNTPGVLLAQMAAPALAAGNAIVVKPSEYAPCSVLELARIVDDVGFPPGVINIVTGLGPVVGQALCDHPLVAKLALTGGPEAGRIVAGRAAERLTPVVMELGGKSAHVVFDDVDLDEAADGIVAGFVGAGGQSCVAGTRAVVHRSIHDALVARLVERVKRVRLGDPADPETDMGPMCTADQVARVQGYVDAGLAEGATLTFGGRSPQHDGTLFFPPTIFTDVRSDMSIAQQEIFGPVLSVLPFDTDDDAVTIANGTAYGLAAGIWTNHLDRAHRIARRLRAGTVWVNHYRRGDAAFPFGGYGLSGYGRVNGIEGYREMTRTKSIQILLR